MTPRYRPARDERARRAGDSGRLVGARARARREILDASVAASDDPRARIAAWGERGEIGRWVQALVAPSPGARPSAAWIATRAARWLGVTRRRRRRGERARGAGAACVRRRAPTRDPRGRRGVGGASRGRRARGSTTRSPGPQSCVARGRPAESSRSDRSTRRVGSPPSSARAQQGGRSTTCTRARSGSASWRSRVKPRPRRGRDVDVLDGAAPSAWASGEGGERIGRLVGELSRAARTARHRRGEDDVASGVAPAPLTVGSAEALVRTGEVGRAWAAATTLDDATRWRCAQRSRGGAAIATGREPPPRSRRGARASPPGRALARRSHASRGTRATSTPRSRAHGRPRSRGGRGASARRLRARSVRTRGSKLSTAPTRPTPTAARASRPRAECSSTPVATRRRAPVRSRARSPRRPARARSSTRPPTSRAKRRPRSTRATSRAASRRRRAQRSSGSDSASRRTPRGRGSRAPRRSR